MLTAIKRQTLPPGEQKVKVKRLRFLVFDLAARLIRHSRYLFARVKKSALEQTYTLGAHLLSPAEPPPGRCAAWIAVPRILHAARFTPVALAPAGEVFLVSAY